MRNLSFRGRLNLPGFNRLKRRGRMKHVGAVPT
jgi:hypothetical protein